MNFPVPWRALLPIDALPVLTGLGGSILKEICDASGAQVDISGEGETPATLSDKIVTFSGAVEQKEAACRRCVDKLRELQEVHDQEPGVFVIIVPSCAAPMVVGQKGAQIKEVIELSGAEISVGKENIMGMVDQPIGITGTGGQVVSAVSKINAILQDLADRGKLQPSDFKYRPGAVTPDMAQRMGDSSGFRPTFSNSNPMTHAKFVVATQVAGWIIGKQGRHIRELQENSGSHIQVLKEGDVPPGVSPTDRIVEIGGRFEARAEGIQIVLMAIDSMPALQAPRETSMLVAKALTTDAQVQDVQKMSGCEVEVRDLPGYHESLCTLLGTIEARVKAGQNFLTRLEELAENGTPSSVPPPTEVPRQPQRRMEEAPAPRPAPAPAPSLPREEPRPAQVEPATRPNDPWSDRDPWGGGQNSVPPSRVPEPVKKASLEPDFAPAAAPKPLPERSFEPAPRVSTTTFKEPEAEVVVYSPQEPAPTARTAASQESLRPTFSEPPAKQMDTGGAMDMQMSFRPDGPSQSTSSTQEPPKPLMAPKTMDNGHSHGMQMSFRPDTPSQPSAASSSMMSFGPDGGSSGPAESGTSFSPGPGGFGQAGPGGPMGSSSSMGSMGGMGSMGSFGGMGVMDGMGGMFGGMGGPMGGMGMGMAGMGGVGQMAFQTALQSSFFGQQRSQLLLALPTDLIQKALIPSGHFAEIAEKCHIQIDLGREMPPNMREVSMTGTVVANAMAIYFLQERTMQHIGGRAM